MEYKKFCKCLLIEVIGLMYFFVNVYFVIIFIDNWIRG